MPESDKRSGVNDMRGGTTCVGGQVEYRRNCGQEYLDSIVFYSGSAEQIADAIEFAIAKIGSEPHRFREIEAGVRRCRVTRFP
jgi:hypothetical protein